MSRMLAIVSSLLRVIFASHHLMHIILTTRYLVFIGGLFVGFFYGWELTYDSLSMSHLTLSVRSPHHPQSH